MQFISCHDGKLQTLASAGLKTGSTQPFSTGLAALDEFAPGGAFARGAVHELLFEARHGRPMVVAAVMARGSSSPSSCLDVSDPSCLLPVIWSDPRGDLYPPGLAGIGFDLSRTYLLRTNNEADEMWAVAECLRCRGVGAVVAAPGKISRIEARRFQLAAERGGSVGILLRQTGRGDSIYAAATRWKVSPYPGERTIQRWTIQLLHGHGGRIGQSVILEWCRENNSVRAVEKFFDRPATTTTAARATA